MHRNLNEIVRLWIWLQEMEEGNRTGATVDDSLVQLAREEKLKLWSFFSQKNKKNY